MPGPLVHLGVGLVALLLYFDERHRAYALLLLPFAVLPDLDHFAPFYAPRVYFHNVFIFMVPLALALYGWASKWRLAFDVGLIGGFCLLSHLVLDLFTGGEALFYPLTVAGYSFEGRPAHVFNMLTFALFPDSLQYYRNVVLGVIMCAFIFACILIVKKHVHTTRAPATTPTWRLCPVCGEPMHKTRTFCARCGVSLEGAMTTITRNKRTQPPHKRAALPTGVLLLVYGGTFVTLILLGAIGVVDYHLPIYYHWIWPHHLGI